MLESANVADKSAGAPMGESAVARRGNGGGGVEVRSVSLGVSAGEMNRGKVVVRLISPGLGCFEVKRLLSQGCRSIRKR
jgi:hypothetical protein